MKNDMHVFHKHCKSLQKNDMDKTDGLVHFVFVLDLPNFFSYHKKRRKKKKENKERELESDGERGIHVLKQRGDVGFFFFF